MDKKHVLQQFEWFQVQTKVRQIINQILSPLEKKLYFNSADISKLQQSSKRQMEKIEMLTMMVNKDPKIFQTGIFKHISQSFTKQLEQNKYLASRIDENEFFVNKKIDLMNNRLAQNSKAFNDVINFKQYVEKQLEHLKNGVSKSQDNIGESFEQINKQIRQLKAQIQNFTQMQQKQIIRNRNTEQTVINSVKKTQYKLNNFNQLIQNIKLQGEKNESNISFLLTQIKRVDEFQKKNKKVERIISDMQYEINKLEFKVEAVNPLVSFCQQNQYLHQILPQKYHKKISIYFHRKSKQMVELILNKQYSQQKINRQSLENLQLIKMVHERSIKTVFKLKKDRLIKMGIDFDHLSHQKRQQLLTSINLDQIDDQLTDDYFSAQNNQSVDEKSLKEFIKTLIQNLSIELKDKIFIQINDSKKYLTDMEFCLKKQIQVFEKKYTKFMDQSSNKMAQIQLLNDYLEKQLKKQATETSRIKIEVINLQGAVKKINSILAIINSLQQQDQLDRQSIALYGIKQKHKDQFESSKKDQLNKDSVIKMERNCLSCSGNSNYFNHFFKLACLAYKSSPIQLQNQEYKRQELIDKSKLLTDKIKAQFEVLFDKKQKSSLIFKSNQIYEESKELYSQSGQSLLKINSRIQNASTNDRYIIRNISSSQDFIRKSNHKNTQQSILQGQSPRIINPTELSMEEIMKKATSQIWNRKRQRMNNNSNTKLETEKSQKKRKQYMMNVSSYFNDLKKKNSSFLK